MILLLGAFNYANIADSHSNHDIIRTKKEYSIKSASIDNVVKSFLSSFAEASIVGAGIVALGFNKRNAQWWKTLSRLKL